jgi:secondary thiamine-phosphate synthase enzyme
MDVITIQTSKKEQLLDITKKVQELVKLSKVKSGICHLYVPHATAALTINENADPNIQTDILDCLDRLIPSGMWKHDALDQNASAHIKTSIFGASESVPIDKGELFLGAWQNIFLCEFDGPRAERTIVVKILEGRN